MSKIETYFFNNQVYGANDFTDCFRNIFNSGVVPVVPGVENASPMKVVWENGMTLKVAQGNAFIRGHLIKIPAEGCTLTLEPALSQDRTDLIALQLNTTAETTDVIVRPGTTVPIQTDTLYELPLALVTVRAEQSTLAEDDIEDERHFTELIAPMESKERKISIIESSDEKATIKPQKIPNKTWTLLKSFSFLEANYKLIELTILRDDYRYFLTIKYFVDAQCLIGSVTGLGGNQNDQYVKPITQIGGRNCFKIEHGSSTPTYLSFEYIDNTLNISGYVEADDTYSTYHTEGFVVYGYATT